MKPNNRRDCRSRQSVKKIISFLLSLTIFGTCIFGFNYSSYALSESGRCGDNITYTFDSSTGDLILSGYGKMYDYNYKYYEKYSYGECDSPFAQKTEIKRIIIDDSISYIGNYAFYYCSNASSVKLPSGLLSLGDCSFAGCRNITYFDLPSTLESIGNHAFSDTGVNKPNVPESIVNIGSSIFSGCHNLTSIDLPSNFDYIPNGMFSYCDSLTEISFRDNIERIGDNAFSGCINLVSIDFNNVTVIGKHAFNGCSNLNNIDFKKVISIGDYSFAFCDKIESLLITNAIVSIGQYAFEYCYGLEKIYIGSSLEYISESAFLYCYNINKVCVDSLEIWLSIEFADMTANPVYYSKRLYISDEQITKLAIPNTISHIYQYAFVKCETLEEIIINDSIMSIGCYAFSDCIGVMSVNVPQNIEYIGGGAFHNIPNIRYMGEVYGAPWGARCLNGFIDGDYIFQDEEKTLLKYCKKTIVDAVIPETTKIIDEGAFSNCKLLTNLYIPFGVTTIRMLAFYNCQNLKNIVFPSSISFLGMDAFMSEPKIALDSITFNGTEEEWNNSVLSGKYYFDKVKVYFHDVHDYQLINHYPSSCIENGFSIYSCSICGRKYTEYFDIRHEFELIDFIEPTCTEDGIKIYACKNCTEFYIEEPEKFGHSEFIEYDTICLSDCNRKGQMLEIHYCETCGEELTRVLHEYEISEHRIIVDKSVPATCVSHGWTEGSHCSVCNTVFERRKLIPATGHSYSVVDYKAATCTKDGYQTVKCNNCDDSYTTYFSAYGHNNELYRSTVSCSRNGYDIYKCKTCGTLTNVQASAEHKFAELVRKGNGILEFRCETCGETEIKTSNEILEMWSDDLFNFSVSEIKNGICFDVSADGIINAKDYAMLLRMQK